MQLTFTETMMTDASQRWDRPFEDGYGGRPGRFHPGRIVLIVVAFLVWWPIGLATLIYLIWSGRMDCGGTSPRWERKLNRMQEKVDRLRARMGGSPWGSVWHSNGGGSGGSWGPSGNSAFDEYRAETLRRLEEEQKEFRDFLERLRQAKDKAEFDQFMAQRRRTDGPRPEAEPAA
jgi:hypothetical protein